MPHLILEYTDNLEFDVRTFFQELHEALVETGAVNMKGLKSRAIKLTDYYIADGHDGYKMVHLNIVLREGRPREIREEIAQRAMAHLEKTFGHHRENGYINISTDMSELEFGLALVHHNIPVGGVPSPKET